MKVKFKVRIKPGLGQPCPKCGRKMELRSHREITAKQRRSPFYFTQWDYCRPCRHLQHYEKYKVFNPHCPAWLRHGYPQEPVPADTHDIVLETLNDMAKPKLGVETDTNPDPNKAPWED